MSDAAQIGWHARRAYGKLMHARDVIRGLLKEAVEMHEDHVWPIDDKLEQGYHKAGRAPRSCTICRAIKDARDLLEGKAP